MRDSWQAVRDAEVERTLNRLNGASAADRHEVEALADRLINKLLHRPTREVRVAAEEPDGHHLVRAYRRLLHQDETPPRPPP